MIQRPDRRGEFPRLRKRLRRNPDLPGPVKAVIGDLNHAIAFAISDRQSLPLLFQSPKRVANNAGKVVPEPFSTKSSSASAFINNGERLNSIDGGPPGADHYADSDYVACNLLAVRPRVRRFDLKQIADVAGLADVAEFDIAHWLREIRVLALARVQARARARALTPAAIRPLTAARVAGRHPRLAWAVFGLLRKPPPRQVGPDRRQLFAQCGEHTTMLGDLRRERGIFRLTPPRQRRKYVGGIGAGFEKALDVVANPQMRVVAQPAVAFVPVDVAGAA
jgi:hypothetical protein